MMLNLTGLEKLSSSTQENCKVVLFAPLPVISHYPVYMPVDSTLLRYLDIAVRVLLKYYKVNNCYVVDPETNETTFDYSPMSEVFNQIGVTTLPVYVEGGSDLETALVNNIHEYMFHVFKCVGGADKLANVDVVVFTDSINEEGVNAFCHL